jgi:hypothetical protein
MVDATSGAWQKLIAQPKTMHLHRNMEWALIGQT